jgi:Putative DNA-binding domain
MAFISGSKNRMLGSKTPDVYLPTIIESKGEQVLEEHAIPANTELWRVGAYSEFLATRRARLAEVVNRFLKDVAAGTVVAVDPVSLLSAGEGESVEFKQTARFNIRTGEVDKAMERAVVKTTAAFFNGRGGTLLIGVNDEGLPVGLDSDVETLTHRPTLDGYEQFLRQTLVNAIGTTMAAGVKVTFPVIEERTICMVQVPPAPKPVYVDGGKLFYLRSGNTTRELSMEEAHGYIQTRFN